MNRLIVLIFFLSAICFLTSYAQHNTDSLRSILPGLKELEKIDVLNQLAYDLKFNDQKAALVYGRQALQLSQIQHYPEGEVKAILNIGIVYDIQGASDSSGWYFTRAYEFAQRAGLEYFEANAVNNLGMMNWNKGNFQDAIVYFFKALKLYEQQENENGISKATSNIGLIYQELSQWDKALEMNLRAYEIRKKEGNQDLLARSCNNIGISYKGLNDYKMAMDYYMLAVKYAAAAKSTGVMAGVYSNMAVISQLQENFGKALEYQLKSLQLRKGIDMLGNLADYNNLSAIYLELGQYRKGIESGFMAIRIADSSKNSGHTDESYYNIGLNYMQINKKDSARHFFDRAFLIRNSIYSDKHARELAILEAGYEKEKKESEILRLTSEAEIRDLKLKQSRNLFFISILGTLFILLGMGFIFTRIRLKQKASLSEERRLQQQERYMAVLTAEELERKRIARELHDGLGQILSTAKLNMSVLEYHSELKYQKAIDNSLHLIDNAVNEVRSISHNLMPNELVSLGLIPAINEQVWLINESGKLKVHTEFPDSRIELDERRAIAIYRAIQEILNNCIRYAEAGNIWLTIEKNKNMLEINIRDDGKGFNTDLLENSKGIGWKNILSRVELINGILEVDSLPGKGTVTKIIMKI